MTGVNSHTVTHDLKLFSHQGPYLIVTTHVISACTVFLIQLFYDLTIIVMFHVIIASHNKSIILEACMS